MDIEKKHEEMARAFESFKAANDKEIKEIKDKGHVSAETKAKVDEINTLISTLQGELKGMQVAMQRTGGGADETPEVKEQKAKMLAKKDVINTYLRKGEGAFSVEQKANSSMIYEDGGYLVDPEMSSEVVKFVYESSPMRQLASVQTISSNEFKILQDLDQVGSGWVGEIASRATTTSAKFKEVAIPVHELYAQPAATQQFLDDASINIDSWLAQKVADKFSRDEATAFVSGSGVNQPMGFLSYASGTSFNQIERQTAANAASIVGDDVIGLLYKLKNPYAANASWLMQRGTEALVRKIKDSQNRYLWEPGLNGASQALLLGRPIYQANDMAAATTGLDSIAIGDFKQGYQIVDRIGLRVLRDAFTAKPYVLFYTTKRVGGGVKNFEAIKVLRMA